MASKSKKEIEMKALRDFPRRNVSGCVEQIMQGDTFTASNPEFLISTGRAKAATSKGDTK